MTRCHFFKWTFSYYLKQLSNIKTRYFMTHSRNIFHPFRIRWIEQLSLFSCKNKSIFQKISLIFFFAFNQIFQDLTIAGRWSLSSSRQKFKLYTICRGKSYSILWQPNYNAWNFHKYFEFKLKFELKIWVYKYVKFALMSSKKRVWKKRTHLILQCTLFLVDWKKDHVYF